MQKDARVSFGFCFRHHLRLKIVIRQEMRYQKQDREITCHDCPPASLSHCQGHSVSSSICEDRLSSASSEEEKASDPCALPWPSVRIARHTGDLPGALSLIHISEPTRLGMISYAVFCLKKKT